MRLAIFSAVFPLFLFGCQPAGGGGNVPNVPNGPNEPDEPAATGILVTSPPGAENEPFDLFTADAGRRLSQAHDLNELLEVDPGTYLLTQYFNEDFVFARNVVVNLGEVTTVALGAIEVTTVTGSEAATYDIYDSDGAALLSRPNDSDRINPVPPGTYTLKEYFDEFTYVSGLTVVAGEVATFEMGAILYAGAEPTYDIYDANGTTVLVRPASAAETRPMPPGTYVLKDYFADTVLAEGVVVEAGESTTVP